MDENITPENQELIDRANIETKQKNWHDAAETLATLYEKMQTFKVNYRLVTALFMDEQYQLASSYADDFLLEYLDDESNFRMIVALAVQNQNFVYAQQLAVLWDDLDVVDEVLKEIRQAEERAQENMKATLDTVARQFYHMSDYDLLAQRDRYESARHLPVAQFVVGAKFLLVDPYALPIIRATLLEDLQKLQIDGVVKYRWLDDEIYTIQLSDVMPLTSSAVFEAAAATLESRLGQEDPIALEMLAHQMRIELTLLYPRVDIAINDIEKWVDNSIAHYYGRSKPDEPENQRQWHEKINALTESFFEN
ncbi:type I restriction endonuclease subunit R [uncultured Leuconostoc sp.]|uniref:type I restriction endonuclease subunit R n=1 Tax=uncultured Leuconostoc sp. TaxID=173262 RepID=UPI002592F63F|nr:type I restriction endonuclease subunit R [uncultured Leuconostoc sp.]